MIALFRVCRNTHIHTHGTDFQLQKFLPPKYWILAIISECSVPLSLLYLCMRCKTIRTSVILYQVLELDLSTSCFFLYMQNILRFPARSITGSLLPMNEAILKQILAIFIFRAITVHSVRYVFRFCAPSTICSSWLTSQLGQVHIRHKKPEKKETLWRKQIPG